jgi:hypothetical protein
MGFLARDREVRVLEVEARSFCDFGFPTDTALVCLDPAVATSWAKIKITRRPMLQPETPVALFLPLAVVVADDGEVEARSGQAASVRPDGHGDVEQKPSSRA